MLSPLVRSDFESVFDRTCIDLDRTYFTTLKDVAAKFRPRRPGNSDAALATFLEAATRALDARAEFAVSHLLRCLRAHGISHSAESRAEALAFLGDALNQQASHLAIFLHSELGFEEYGSFEKLLLRVQLALMSDRQVDSWKGQFNLRYAESAQTTARIPSASAVNIENVEVLQVANHAQANVSKTVNTAIKGEIVRALDLMSSEIGKATDTSNAIRNDLRELVSQMKTEVSKPQPNRNLLVSALRAISETTKFVGSLKGAYEVASDLLDALG